MIANFVLKSQHLKDKSDVRTRCAQRGVFWHNFCLESVGILTQNMAGVFKSYYDTIKWFKTYIQNIFNMIQNTFHPHLPLIGVGCSKMVRASLTGTWVLHKLTTIFCVIRLKTISAIFNQNKDVIPWIILSNSFAISL